MYEKSTSEIGREMVTRLLAAGVEDVDAAYETLSARGVRFLRPPIDQPWGLRTAYFADPEGNLWEINQSIDRKPAQ